MSRTVLLFLCLFAGGCSLLGEAPAPPPRKPVRYVPPADEYVRSKLLDFDSPLDTSFIISNGVKLVEDPQKPGNRVLSAPGAKLKLGSLVRGRDFPGLWDLVGIRIRADRAVGVRAEFQSSSGTVLQALEAATQPRWTMLWIDLRKLPTTMPAGEELLLAIKPLDGKAILIDEVILAQSRLVAIRSNIPDSQRMWQVVREGVQWEVQMGEERVYALPAAPFVEGGYRLVESNPVRAVFSSPAGTLSIDRHGRLIENGVAKFDARVARYAQAVAENASPATVEVDEHGRVERNLPGDRDNDGYDEVRGCYTVRASSSRLNVRLSPGVSSVRWPVLEVIGLPPGALSVWLEGQLVTHVTRLSDGRAVIELPIRLERAVEVQIRVR
jgi:hypothetical protein